MPRCLPRWRGAAPIERAIEAGDAATGVTIMQMDEGLDTGPVHRAKRPSPIDPGETAGSLHDKLAELGARRARRRAAGAWRRASRSRPDRSPRTGVDLRRQDRRGRDAAIDWRARRRVDRRIRAFDPVPGARAPLTGRAGQDVGLARCRRRRRSTRRPGPCSPSASDGLDVACGDGSAVRIAAAAAGGRHARWMRAAFAAGRQLRARAHASTSSSDAARAGACGARRCAACCGGTRARHGARCRRRRCADARARAGAGARLRHAAPLGPRRRARRPPRDAADRRREVAHADRRRALPARPHARARVRRRRPRGRGRRSLLGGRPPSALVNALLAPLPARARGARRRGAATSPVARWSHPRVVDRARAARPSRALGGDPRRRQRAAAADAARQRARARRAKRCCATLRGAGIGARAAATPRHRRRRAAAGDRAAGLRRRRVRRAGPRARSSPRRCSTRATACACSMRARRRAARPRIIAELADVDIVGARQRRGAARRAFATTSRACASIATAARVSARATPRDPATWWDGVPFDRILADVPCTASGVVRRHPDGKWLRRASRRGALRGDAGRAILAALWPLLAPGGRLLYVHLLGVRRGERAARRGLRRAPRRRVARNPQLSGRMSLHAGGQLLPSAEPAQATIRTDSFTRCSARPDASPWRAGRLGGTGADRRGLPSRTRAPRPHAPPPSRSPHAPLAPRDGCAIRASRCARAGAASARCARRIPVALGRSCASRKARCC